MFLLAAFSDGLDGYLARSRGQITRLGTILDPLADKFLLNTAVVGMVLLHRNYPQAGFPVPVWFAVLMVSRDLLIVSGALAIRIVRSAIEIRPSVFGKAAAVAEMAAVIWLLLKIPRPEIIFWPAAVLIAISGIGYLFAGLRQLWHRA